MVSGAHEKGDHMGVEHALDWLPIDVGYQVTRTQASLKSWTPLVNILGMRKRVM